MAGATVVVSVGRVAGAVSVGSALASMGSMDTSVWSLSARLSSSALFAQCCKVIRVTTHIALLPLGWALDIGVAVAMLVAAVMGEMVRVSA